jgi:tetratricopeptide (TPR) repeat protein
VIGGYFTLATCYDSTNRLDDSLGILEKILPILCLMEDYKRLARTYYKISDIYIKKTKYEDAILNISKSLKFCDMIKESDMKNVIRLHNQLLLANISFKKNNLNQALNQTILVIKNAKASNKTDNETTSLLAWSYLSLGEIYCQMEDFENAQKAIEESISLFESCKVLSRLPEAYRMLGVIYTKLDHAEEALKQYEKAYSLLAKSDN